MGLKGGGVVEVEWVGGGDGVGGGRVGSEEVTTISRIQHTTFPDL